MRSTLVWLNRETPGALVGRCWFWCSKSGGIPSFRNRFDRSRVDDDDDVVCTDLEAALLKLNLLRDKLTLVSASSKSGFVFGGSIDS